MKKKRTPKVTYIVIDLNGFADTQTFVAKEDALADISLRLQDNPQDIDGLKLYEATEIEFKVSVVVS